jgi:ribose 5-phosphate isomerase B
VLDAGTHDEASVDYPDFAHEVAAKVACRRGRARRAGLRHRHRHGDGGQPPPRHPRRRAARRDRGRLTRAHNDCNVACFGARLLGEEVAQDALAPSSPPHMKGGRTNARWPSFPPKGTSHERDHRPLPARALLPGGVAEADPS